jgi:hypothetical protein
MVTLSYGAQATSSLLFNIASYFCCPYCTDV